MEDESLSLGGGEALQVPQPVLFNTFKHHAGRLRAAIQSIGHAEEVAAWGKRLAILGTRLMDLYTGTLSPRELADWVLEELARIDRLQPDRYKDWLEQSEDYAVFTHPVDSSRWVLRLGDEAGRYVHLHPGRWSPFSLRVRANVLKTAFLVLCHVRVHGGDALDRRLINAVRVEHLGLSPLGDDPSAELGLGAVIELLRS